MAPVFLNLQDALRINRDQIERYGGAPGLRDLGLLESAVAMPQAGFGDSYLHQDLFEMAAAYFFHLAMNHLFLDGAKRAGTAAALVFLELNNVEIKMSQDDLVEMALAVARGKADQTAIAAFFRRRVKKKPKPAAAG